MKRPGITICIFVAIISVAGIELALATDFSIKVPAAIGSTAFVVAAIIGGAWRTAYGRGILGGLVCCWLGDVTGPFNFMIGVYAFLVAHVFFIAGFALRGIDWRRAAATFAPVAIVSLALSAWLLPNVPHKDLGSVLAYLCVISVMVILAGGAATGKAGKIGLVAAIIFFISDIFVARWRFVGGGSTNGIFCYPLYYTACFLLAYSSAVAAAHGPTTRVSKSSA